MPQYTAAIETWELIENIRPWCHTVNVAELPDGRLFVVFSAGQFEDSEDMVCACAVRNVDGSWEKTRPLLGRFEYEGETYIPWCPTILRADDGDLHLFCMGNALSHYGFDPHPHSTMHSCWQMLQGTYRMFHARVHDFVCGRPRMLLPEDSGINVQGRPLQLPGGEWVVPIDKDHHCHFVVLDRNLDNYEKRGDLYADPGILEPSLVRLSNGDILCYLRFCPTNWNWSQSPIGRDVQGYIFTAVSRDECRTWSMPIETNLPNPNSGIDINLSRTSQRLLLTFNNSHALRLPMSVGISDDMGKTFRVRDVETGLTDPRYTWRFGNYMINCHAYPKLHQTSDGVWHLFYTHRYDCIKHVWFDEDWLEAGRKMIGLDE